MLRAEPEFSLAAEDARKPEPVNEGKPGVSLLGFPKGGPEASGDVKTDPTRTLVHTGSPRPLLTATQRALQLFNRGFWDSLAR